MTYIDDEDDPRVLRDGETLRVPLHLCDATQRAIAGAGVDLSDHAPGYRGVNDAAVQDARRAARDSYVRNLTTEWQRGPARDAAEPDAATELLRGHLRTESDDDAQARRDRAYADYCARVSQAWQQINPAARANSVERQRRRWTGERAT